jgi:hypothetical protein
MPHHEGRQAARQGKKKRKQRKSAPARKQKYVRTNISLFLFFLGFFNRLFGFLGGL